MIEERYKKQVIASVLSHVPACTIYLFGSRARATHQQGSDIDIALDAGMPIPLATLCAIKQALEESTIPLFIDVIDTHAVGKEFLDDIKKDWVIWHN